MSDAITRISSPDDPHRCQGMTAKGQCMAVAVETSPGVFGKYCMIHGGASEMRTQEKHRLNRYRLSKFQAQYQDQLNQPDVKSLRDEVAILRMMLEERLNACQSASELVVASGPISELIQKIERVVVSCHKLELAADQLLDKARLAQIADQVVKAVSSHMTPDKLAAASADILAAFTEGGQTEQKKPTAAPLPAHVLDISDDDDDVNGHDN